MAKTFISPGTFTQEIDLSYLPQQGPQVTTCFIGLSERGPALRPVVVQNWQEYTRIFGNTNENYYMPYAVENFFRNQSPATIIRVLSNDTYTYTQGGNVPNIIALIGSQSIDGLNNRYENRLFGLIAFNSGTVTNIDITGSLTNFNFSYTYEGTENTATGLSMNPDDSNYFKNVLNILPSSSYPYHIMGGYCWDIPYITASSIGINVAYENRGSGSAIASGTYVTGNVSLTPGQYTIEDDLTKYSNAYTPWILSQNFGSLRNPLYYTIFRFHSLSSGDASNTAFKISIVDVQASPNTDISPYGQFSVLVREFDDTDSNPVILEQFTNMNIDPTSDNYVAKIIGNGNRVWNNTTEHFDETGEYNNNSKYIRVELHDNLDDFPHEALPMGFELFETPAWGVSSLVSYNTTVLPLVNDNITDSSIYLGIDFAEDISDALQVSLLHKIGGDTDEQSLFNLDVLNGRATYSLDAGTSFTKYRKFSVPLYKGWDAYDHSITQPFGSTMTTGLITAYKIANDIMGNKEEINFKDLYIPGVSNTSVTSDAITKVEDRADALYIADFCQFGDSISTIVSNTSTVNSTFTATYYPWVQIKDNQTGKYVWVPPSIAACEAISYNDKSGVGYPWYAPAGLRRGGITSVIRTDGRLYQTDRDQLYSNGINPIAQMARVGIVVYGQKTLAKKASALDRINVRRLVVHIKKYVETLSRNILFEQNGPVVWNAFKNNLIPFLEDIKSKQGLYNLRVVMDETINTADIVDRNICKGQIFLQPQKAAEFISIDFVIEPTGTTFAEQ